MELIEHAHAFLQNADVQTRAEAGIHLDKLIAELEQAVALWQGVDTGTPRHPLGSIFSMVGGTVSEQLFDLHMETEKHLKTFCGLAGVAMAARATLPPPLVETAYWQLEPEESLAERVAHNIAVMTRRLERLREMRTTLQAARQSAPYRQAA